MRINQVVGEGVGFVEALVVGLFIVVSILGHGVLDQLGERQVDTVLLRHCGIAGSRIIAMGGWFGRMVWEGGGVGR
jgi:hypothetical protein